MDAHIPLGVWQCVKDFLSKGATGSVTIHAVRGRILAWEVTEHTRLTTDDEINKLKASES
jgi:hypothetical protein